MDVVALRTIASIYLPLDPKFLSYFSYVCLAYPVSHHFLEPVWGMGDITITYGFHFSSESSFQKNHGKNQRFNVLSLPRWDSSHKNVWIGRGIPKARQGFVIGLGLRPMSLMFLGFELFRTGRRVPIEDLLFASDTRHHGTITVGVVHHETCVKPALEN